MKAVVFLGIGDVRLDNIPEPRIERPQEAIVRLTPSAICGTDLHMIRGTVSPMRPGTILGHEGVGVVQEVVVFSLLALAGTAVALTRNPKRQIFIAGVYGLLRGTVFYMVHSPDVALSELAVGSIDLPVLVLLTLARLDKAK
jgi:uncharacterized MnhB-related membrane protein